MDCKWRLVISVTHLLLCYCLAPIRRLLLLLAVCCWSCLCCLCRRRRRRLAVCFDARVQSTLRGSLAARQASRAGGRLVRAQPKRGHCLLRPSGGTHKAGLGSLGKADQLGSPMEILHPLKTAASTPTARQQHSNTATRQRCNKPTATATSREEPPIPSPSSYQAHLEDHNRLWAKLCHILWPAARARPTPLSSSPTARMNQLDVTGRAS